jgi:hypothetical protein
MQPSLRNSGSTHKDKSGAKFVPPPIPPPGEELADLIRQGRREGRAVWRVYSLVVPRLQLVAVRDPDTGGPILYRPLTANRDARPYFRSRVLLYLETAEPAALQLLEAHDRVELRQLTAAALRDIWGRRNDYIASKLGHRYDRTARSDVADGRKLWPHLCAWPWSEWSEGKPPPTWWKSGPDPTLAAALQTWATGEPVLAGA